MFPNTLTASSEKEDVPGVCQQLPSRRALGDCMNVHFTALGHRVLFGSSPVHNSERERVTCTPDCQASSRVKERIHSVQELQHCLKPEMATDPGNTGPTCCFSSGKWGSELQMMSLMALIASNATGVLLWEQMILILWAFSVCEGCCRSVGVFIFLITVKPLRMMILCYSSVYPFVRLSCAIADHLGQRTLLLCQ